MCHSFTCKLGITSIRDWVKGGTACARALIGYEITLVLVVGHLIENHSKMKDLNKTVNRPLFDPRVGIENVVNKPKLAA